MKYIGLAGKLIEIIKPDDLSTFYLDVLEMDVSFPVSLVDDDNKEELELIKKLGGPGSGHYGHQSKIGHRGGSVSSVDKSFALPSSGSKTSWEDKKQILRDVGIERRYKDDIEFRSYCDIVYSYTNGYYKTIRDCAAMTDVEWEHYLAKVWVDQSLSIESYVVGTLDDPWWEEGVPEKVTNKVTNLIMTTNISRKEAIDEIAKLYLGKLPYKEIGALGIPSLEYPFDLDEERQIDFDEYRKGCLRLVEEIKQSPRHDRIYRGIDLRKREGFALTPSDVFPIGEELIFGKPISFTKDKGIARKFALGTAGGLTKKKHEREYPVVFSLRNAPGLDISIFSKWVQKEVLTIGRFKVTKVDDSFSIDEVSEVELEYIS